MPRVIITDKLKRYVKKIKGMCLLAEHKGYIGMNNRIENAQQSTRRKEKCLIKKSSWGMQQTLSLISTARNIFVVEKHKKVFDTHSY